MAAPGNESYPADNNGLIADSARSRSRLPPGEVQERGLGVDVAEGGDARLEGAGGLAALGRERIDHGDAVAQASPLADRPLQVERRDQDLPVLKRY